MKKFSRLLIAGVAMCAAVTVSAETAYPTKPITLILGFPPGGGADSVGRVYANALTKILKQPVVVENRPGAGSTIEIGRAHVCTPVTNAHLVCRLLLEKK